MTTLAQLMQQDEDNRNRYRQALDMLLDAEREVDQLIADLKEAQAEYAKERERLKTEMAQLRASRRQGSFETRSEKSKEGDAGNAVAKGKGKEKEKEASRPATPANGKAKKAPAQATPINEKKCREILKTLSRVPEAPIFLRPVDPVLDGCPT